MSREKTSLLEGQRAVKSQLLVTEILDRLIHYVDKGTPQIEVQAPGSQTRRYLWGLHTVVKPVVVTELGFILPGAYYQRVKEPTGIENTTTADVVLTLSGKYGEPAEGAPVFGREFDIGLGCNLYVQFEEVEVGKVNAKRLTPLEDLPFERLSSLHKHLAELAVARPTT